MLRPDEEESLSEIERDRKLRRNLKMGAETAITLGGAAASAPIRSAGGKLASKIMPFLNKYVPMDLAIKGISKVSPEVGNFLKKGMSMGLDAEEGLNFLRDRIEPKEETQKEEPKKEAEKKNIVEMYSPELHQFILDQMNQGRSPLEAGALASLEKKGQKDFKKIIKKIEGDHKAPWSAILQTVYGQGEKAQPQKPQQQAQQQKPPGKSLLNDEAMAVLNEMLDFRKNYES